MNSNIKTRADNITGQAWVIFGYITLVFNGYIIGIPLAQQEYVLKIEPHGQVKILTCRLAIIIFKPYIHSGKNLVDIFGRIYYCCHGFSAWPGYHYAFA